MPTGIALVPERLSDADHRALAGAYAALEHPSFAARASSVVGTPIDQGLRLLPPRWYSRIRSGAEAAVTRALGVAIESLGTEPPAGARPGVHRLMAIGTGAAGGFFGLPSMLLELPVTSVIMLRAIADVARSQGEDLGDPAARLACLEVFALGGSAHGAVCAEIGYYEVRTALALHFSTVAVRVAERGIGAKALPGSVSLIRAVAARFGVVVSDKAALQMVPVMGAAAGALINAVFMRHFQDVAQGHFTVRRLERAYGTDAVARAYAGLRDADRAQDNPPPTSAVSPVSS
jgi:hypothetical protein